MDFKEIKQRIGTLAKSEIVNYKGLTLKKGFYDCPISEHRKHNPHCKWYDNSFSFYCHDCEMSYDIFSLAEEKYIDKLERFKYLHVLAGIEWKEKKLQSVKPISRERQQGGLDYLNKRKISIETIKKYTITTDKNGIYFNYLTPNKKLINVKTRKFPEKKFFIVPNAQAILYGMHLLHAQKHLVLCEGEIDALSAYELMKSAKLEKDYLCSSVPYGASSLRPDVIANCITWLNCFEDIIIIPDNDEAGNELLKNASEILDDYSLFRVEIPTKYKDLNEMLIESTSIDIVELFKNKKKIIPELKFSLNSTKIDNTSIENGYKTGYVTHDYNDNGLKKGCLTLVTGKYGSGKTTFTRQIVITLAREDIKSFYFIGEASVGTEKRNLVRLIAQKAEILYHHGLAGSVRYYPDDGAIKRFNSNLGQKIILSDEQAFRESEYLFNDLLKEMYNLVKNYGVKVFNIDNLMVLCQKEGNQLFSEQKNIILSLKSFCVRTGSHVVLNAHPKKGDEEAEISGAQEIVNLADTIIRYIRLDEKSQNKLSEHFPNKQDIIKRASARIKTEKVREDGTKKIAFLEWDEQRGALYDLSDLDMAREYEKKGYWSKYTH